MIKKHPAISSPMSLELFLSLADDSRISNPKLSMSPSAHNFFRTDLANYSHETTSPSLSGQLLLFDDFLLSS
jgi:hypothetical protein